MVRLFLDPKNISRNKAIINGSNVKYLRDVLRCHPGDEIFLLDGLGKEYKGYILSIGKHRIEAELIETSEGHTESPLNINLAQAVPKAEKMDLIVQKASELGIKRFIPILSLRVISRPAQSKIERWRKIAQSAAQQSGRSLIPKVDDIKGYKDFISQPIEETGLIFWEEEKRRGLKEILRGLKGKEITLLIGPEGGFTKEEVRLAIERGFYPLGLGPRILRTETAAITALSILQYELGDMG